MIRLLALAIAASTPDSLAPDFLKIDISTHQAIEQNWSGAQNPVPVGSLVKPFLALAYSGEWPEHVCSGEHCWLSRGHGRLKFREALAQSCNEYFLNLAERVDADALALVARKYGITPPENDSAQARIGLGTGWKIPPLALARAYAELSSRASEPRVAEILEGLRLAARSGTARAIGGGRMAKTGTAQCLSRQQDAGDGFVLVIEPAEAPRAVLLIRVHGTTGAAAAKIAAKMLK